MHHIERLLRASDPELVAHGERTGRLAADIARTMGLPDENIHLLEQAGLLHDAGKVFISREILDKPGPLDDAEWDVLRRHPMMGYRLVGDVVPDLVAEIVLTHHEWFDGTGYPNALPGSKVPIEARIIQVADAFDAITSNRPYQPALPVVYALNELVRCSGTQFDPAVVEATLFLADRLGWAAEVAV